MQEEKQKILDCFVCSLKFNEKVWYDLHLSLIHANRNEVEYIETKHKNEKDVLEVEYVDVICEPILENPVEAIDFDKDSLLIPIKKTKAQRCKEWRDRQDQGLLRKKAAERMRIRR